MAIAQTRLDQIRDLVNQWEQLAGYSVSVSDWDVSAMAAEPGKYMTLFDVGQFMQWYSGNLWWQSVPAGALDAIPWAKYGMSALEYNTKFEAYDNSFLQLTGQNLTQDLLDQALKTHQGVMTGAQFNTWLMSQDSIKNTYGWLKYGLDFQQFQQQKLQMQTSFGGQLSDAEAVVQLQYAHAAQGPNVSVAAQQTLTQVEKKQAQTGVGQNVVR